MNTVLQVIHHPAGRIGLTLGLTIGLIGPGRLADRREGQAVQGRGEEHRLRRRPGIGRASCRERV